MARASQATVSLADLSTAELEPAEIVKGPGSTIHRMSMFQKANASGVSSNRSVRFSPGANVTRWKPLSSSTGPVAIARRNGLDGMA